MDQWNSVPCLFNQHMTASATLICQSKLWCIKIIQAKCSPKWD